MGGHGPLPREFGSFGRNVMTYGWGSAFVGVIAYVVWKKNFDNRMVNRRINLTKQSQSGVYDEEFISGVLPDIVDKI